VLGISVDGVWSHEAFVESRHLRFPLLSDYEPKGEVARRYGAYDHQDGCAQRALFVVDRDGTIAWSFLSPPALNPGADGILDALEALKNKRS
jgi:peroxiredoxin